MCRICDVLLVEDPASAGDEGDAYFRDDDDLDPSFPADHVFLVEVAGEEEFAVVRSVLLDAGIPFVVEEITASPDNGRTSDALTAHAPVRIAVRKEYLRQARDVLQVRVYRPVSELRAKALETRLFSDIIWSAVWFAAGFGIACLLVPGEWDQEVKFLTYAVAGLIAVPVGNAIRRRGRKAGRKQPWLNE